MPIYEITIDGEEYEVDAPDEETALAALNIGDQTTMSEDLQGFGTKILDGLLFGFGDEASSAALAAIDSTRARLFGKELSTMGEEDFSASYEKMLNRQRDVEQRFQEQSPGIALAAEVAGGVGTGLLTGGAALKGAAKLAGKAGTTRGSML